MNIFDSVSLHGHYQCLNSGPALVLPRVRGEASSRLSIPHSVARDVYFKGRDDCVIPVLKSYIMAIYRIEYKLPFYMKYPFSEPHLALQYSPSSIYLTPTNLSYFPQSAHIVFTFSFAGEALFHFSLANSC